MKRWLIVLLVLVASAAALYGVRSYRPTSGVADELLAYEAPGQQALRLLVPAEVQYVWVTSWLQVPEQAVALRRYPYTFEASLRDTDGNVLFSRRYEYVSRISGDPHSPLDAGRFSARLADSNDWVTDPRTTEIDVSVLTRRGGVIELRPARGASERVVFRAAHDQPRGDWERRVFQRTLDIAARQRLVSERASLGFVDLPGAQREQALRSWGRRLAALGKDGQEYFSRRLLSGNFREEEDLGDAPPELTFSVKPSNPAVFNLSGAITLRFHGRPSQLLQMREGELPALSLSVGPTGWVELELKQVAPRSLVLRTEVAAEVGVSVASGDARAQLGAVKQFPVEGRVFLKPDRRTQRFYALDPVWPLSVSLAPGQPYVGLTVRGLSQVRSDVHAKLFVRWLTAAEPLGVSNLDIELQVSEFAHQGERFATEPRSALILPPPDAVRLEIHGDPALMVSPWTLEPDVGESRLQPAYDIELPEGLSWNNAPFEIKRWATLRPDNDAELRLGGRALWLRTQVYLGAATLERGRPIKERMAEPVARRAERGLFTQTWHNPLARDVQQVWTQLRDDAASRVVVTPEKSERVTLELRRGPSSAGPWQLWLDDALVAARAGSAAYERLSLALAAGEHTLKLSGLGPEGVAFLAAPPSRAAQAFKRQRVFELRPQAALDFAFERRPGELLSLLVMVVSEGQAQSVALSYALDQADARLTTGRFVRRLTPVTGTLSGRTEAAGRVLLWDYLKPALPAEPPPSALGGSAGDVAVATTPRFDAGTRLSLPLGDDLAPGRHTLRLALAPTREAAKVWVRVVVAGRSFEE